MSRAHWNDAPIPERIGVPTALGLRVLRGPVHAFVRVFFRAELSGDVPDGPCVIVGNHPPSIGGGEFLSFMALWAKRYGGEKPLAAFAHAAMHGAWPTNWALRQIGAIPTTYAAAEAALARGVPVIVFPGGDHESFRPFWTRGADLKGREGFLKIARKAGVPIVPVRISGQSAPVVLRSSWLAFVFVWPAAMGWRRYGLTALALLGALIAFALPIAWPWRAVIAWAWCAMPLSLFPWLPVKVRIRFGKPISNASTTADVENAIDAIG